ncbi:MAG: D-aminoacylase [Planctomycetota bacterium]|mgnify:CR=1 FL=1
MGEASLFPKAGEPILFRGATVVDGSGAPSYAGDVRVEGDRIVQVGQARAEGARIVEARGLVLAPGFIDAHSHSDLRVLTEPSLPVKVREGVTCEVIGQDGLSVAPVSPEHVAERRAQLKAFLGDPPIEWSWRRVSEYLEAVRRAEPAVDVAYLVPHGALREIAMGMEAREPSPDERATMERLLDEGLQDGAVGLSTGLIYPPCCHARTDELIRLGRVVARYDGVVVAHIRNEGDFVVQALEELVRVGREAECRVHVSHLKIAGRRNWGKLDQVLTLLEEAVGEVELTADQYPYVAGATSLAAILPPWAQAGGAEAIVARLADPSTRARIREAVLDPRPAEWDNTWAGSGPEGIVVSDVPSGCRPELVGKSLSQAAGERDPIDFTLDLLREEKLAVSMVCFSQCEEVVEAFLRLPFVCVSTDGLLGGRPHPRAYGTFPRVLARYVRERKVLTMEQAVRKMSSLASHAYRLTEVGEIEVGSRANLVLFDPASVRDKATFDDPCQYPEGIVHVMRNGRFEF